MLHTYQVIYSIPMEEQVGKFFTESAVLIPDCVSENDALQKFCNLYYGKYHVIKRVVEIC